LIDTIFTELGLYQIIESIETIYIGGGSPSCLPRELLTETVVSLVSEFKDVKEFTIECNPAQADPGTLKVLRTLGVNRLSIGAQSFAANELQTLGRIHNPEQITLAVEGAQSAGFENIGLDLIFGIPGSAIDSWRFSLECAIELGVQHISAYSLTIEPNTPFDRAVRGGTLSTVDAETDRAMYEMTRKVLTKSGYMQYEISNFAKPGFECHHNIRYWKNLPVIGIGPAAAGWYKGRRTTNVADIEKYITKVKSGEFAYVEEYSPNPQQIACETAVLGLRMIEGIDRVEYKKQTDFNLMSLFGNVIKVHRTNRLIECNSTHCCLTKKGLSYADTVAADYASLD
jgi:oxygen-independent coproporphyrinogen-3 oxidase